MTKSFSAMTGETTVISDAITACPIQFGFGRQSILNHAAIGPSVPRMSWCRIQEL